MIFLAVEFQQFTFKLFAGRKECVLELTQDVAIKKLSPVLRYEHQMHNQFCHAMALSNIVVKLFFVTCAHLILSVKTL